MKPIAGCAAALLLALVFASARAAAQATPAPTLEPVLSNLSSPVFLTSARDGTNRLFVVEQPGRIQVLQPNATTPSVFLDITARVLDGGERGLLGLAFHPQFAANRRLFVNYTREGDGATVIAEYRVSAANPNLVDQAETVLLVIPQPFANHNGGMIAFGPDGFLYIGMGDGGSANDPGNRAQNVEDLLGKMLRINVDQPNGSVPYSSPPDNPFFGATAGRDEIYATGLRNPFRFSFDRSTGQLYLGDVGQGVREEIDIITRGGNYGWRVFEGTRCTGLGPAACNPANFVAPIAEYEHTGGRCSVTGGYVYRGTRATLPAGTYVFADFCTGEIFQLQGTTMSPVRDTAVQISSFGEDEAGELYVVGLGGTVHRLANASCAYTVSPAARTSPGEGETFNVSVTTQSGCAWSAVSNAGFITVASGASGTGGGTVGLTVAPNGSGVPRTGTVFIAGQVVTVTQPEVIPQAPTVQFGQAAYGVSEGAARATVTVTRTDTTGTVTAQFRTVDDPAAVPCADATGKAFARCDYATTVDTITFAPGETSKEISVPIVDDAHVEGGETLQLHLTDVTGVAVLGAQSTATLTIADNDTNAGAPNPITGNAFFVRMHYLDFLSREPEAGEPWTGILDRCPNVNGDPSCDRVLVSQSFFLSTESSLKGFYTYLFYRVAFNRRPAYEEITPDMRSLAGATPQEVFARRAAYAEAITQRPEFAAAFGQMTNGQYVDTLLGRYALQQITTEDPQNFEGATQVTLTRQQLTDALNNSSLSRAQVLRAVAQSNEVDAAEFHGAFVAMQYYGYLRRTPEQPGYDNWLRVIREDPQNVRVMVNGFMNSREYRLRFGPP